MAIESTDEVLINRNGVTYTQQQGEIMAKIKTTDLMLVNREDVTYTVTGEEFIDSVIDPLTLDLSFAPNPPICEQDCTVTGIPVGGKAPYTYDSYQWYVSDFSDGGFGVAIPGADTAVYTIPFGSEDKYFGCRVTITDSRSTSVTQTTYAQAAKIIEISPIIDTVTLTEAAGNSEPWTSASYDVAITKVTGTQPLTNSIRPYVKGSLSSVLDTDVITDVEGDGTNVYQTDTIANVDELSVTNNYGSGTSGTGNPSAIFANGGGYTSPTLNRCDVNFTNLPAATSKITISYKTDGALMDITTENGIVRNSSLAGNSSTTFNVSGTMTTCSLIGNQSNYNVQIGYIYVDDVLLVDGTFPSGETLLTFPTANYFDKFEVGDVLQTNPDYFVLGDTAASPWAATDKIVDNSYELYNGGGATVSKSVSCKRYFPTSSILKWSINPQSQSVQNGPAYSWWCTLYYREGGPDGIQQTKRFGFSNNGNSNNATSRQDFTLDLSTLGASDLYVDIIQFTLQDMATPPNGSSNGHSLIYELTLDDTLIIAYQAATPGVDITSITNIDAAGPTITTDGGSWYGADGTGDAGDGRYEPAQEWSTELTATEAFSSPNGLASLAFNGDLVTNAFTNDGTITFDATGFDINIVSSIRTRHYASEQAVVTTDEGTVTLISPNSGSHNWTNTGTISGKLISIVVTGITGASPNLAAVEIDGKLLVNSSIPGGRGDTDITKTVDYVNKLTFASDGNLSNFQPGFDVEMSASKTIQTSTITNVDELIDANWASKVNGNTTGNVSPSIIFTNTWSDSTVSAGNTVFPARPNGLLVFSPNKLATTIEFMSYRNIDSNSPADMILINGVSYLTEVLDYGSAYNLPFTIDLGVPTLIETISWKDYDENDYFSIGGIKFDGVQLTSTDKLDPVLTFDSPNPDLKYFQPGDQIGTVSGFLPVAYTGNGGTQSIDCGFSPDLVWIKNTDGGSWHQWFDVIRGPLKRIYSNNTDAELNQAGTLASFNSDGFTVGNDGGVNGSSKNYIAWCWDAGDTTVTNNEGSIESQVRSNGNFSVVQWFTQAAEGTVGTGLSSADFVIMKPYNISNDWYIWSKAFSNSSQYLRFDTNQAATNSDIFAGGGAAGGGLVGLGSVGNPNAGMIMYAWQQTPGVSSFGSYGGNRTNNSITTGFKPAFVLIKNVGAESPWMIFDSGRNPSYPVNEWLEANSAAQEQVTSAALIKYQLRFTETGFDIVSIKDPICSTPDFINIEVCRDSDDLNNSGSYIYAAFAGGNPIEVVDVDVAANTMTVDNEGFEVGDTITGDTYKGTGTVLDVDVTNKEMLLSNVTSRWIEGYRAETLTEVEVAKLYAVMQENTGNIISLTSILPDFTDQVGSSPSTFNFPAVFPSGKTPAQTFPFGTELCVDAKLSNPVGSDIKLAEDSGACLQPGFKISSGITDVSEIQIIPWNQSQVWSAAASTTDVATNVGNDIQSLFDGSLSNGPRANPSGSTGTITFPSGTISGNVRIYTGVTGNPGNLGYKDGNTLLSITPVNNTWVNLGNIDLTYLSFLYDGSDILFVLGIELDGQLLVDTGISGAPTVTSNELTFADTTNLNAFERGDTVYMCDANGDVASYTPQTSTIASVSEGAYYTKGGGVIQGGGTWPELFNGTDSGGVYACGGNASNYAVTRWEGGGNVPVINPGGQHEVEFYIRYRDSKSYLEVNGSQRLTGATGVSPIWKSIGYEEVRSFATAQGASCSYQASVSAVRVNGVILDDNPGVLIFETPNPDLKYFKAGDLVAEGEGGYVSTTEPEGRNYNPDNIFDGDPAVTFVQLGGAQGRQEQKWTFNPPIDHIQIELRLSTDSPGNTTGNDIIINNVAVTSQFENSLTTGGAAYNITGTGNQLQSLSLNAAAGYGGAIKLYGILINGNTYVDVPQVENTYILSTDVSANTMTVDGNGWLGSDGSSNGGDGRYQPSQEWSNETVTPATSIDFNYPPSNLFNGVESLDPNNGCRAGSGKTIKWTAAVPITGVETLEIGTYNNTSMTVNGQVVGAPLTMGLAIDLPKATYFPDGILTEMVWSYAPSSGNTATLTYIKVNGKLLVDSSAPGDVKTKVNGFNSLSGTGTFDSFNSNRVDLATSNLNWVSDNSLNETFYMKSDQLTTFMQDNPEHVAIFNAFRDAADQYPLDVNARRSSVVGAVQRLIDGETLSANEAAQVLVNVAIGVNAIEPFTYDGYYPLFYTAEKALAASSMNAYHTHQFDGTDYYMPDGGTLYHGTYVSPEEVEAQHRAANESTYSSATGTTTTGSSSNNSSSY